MTQKQWKMPLFGPKWGVSYKKRLKQLHSMAWTNQATWFEWIWVLNNKTNSKYFTIIFIHRIIRPSPLEGKGKPNHTPASPLSLCNVIYENLPSIEQAKFLQNRQFFRSLEQRFFVVQIRRKNDWKQPQNNK